MEQHKLEKKAAIEIECSKIFEIPKPKARGFKRSNLRLGQRGYRQLNQEYLSLLTSTQHHPAGRGDAHLDSQCQTANLVAMASVKFEVSDFHSLTLADDLSLPKGMHSQPPSSQHASSAQQSFLYV